MAGLSARSVELAGRCGLALALVACAPTRRAAVLPCGASVATDSRFFDIPSLEDDVECAAFMYGADLDDMASLKIEVVEGYAVECRDGLTFACYDPMLELIRVPSWPEYRDGGVRHLVPGLWHELTHWGLHKGIHGNPDGEHVRPEWSTVPRCPR